MRSRGRERAFYLGPCGDRRHRAVAARLKRGRRIGVAAGGEGIAQAQIFRQERTGERVTRAGGVDRCDRQRRDAVPRLTGRNYRAVRAQRQRDDRSTTFMERGRDSRRIAQPEQTLRVFKTGLHDIGAGASGEDDGACPLERPELQAQIDALRTLISKSQ